MDVEAKTNGDRADNLRQREIGILCLQLVDESDHLD